MRKLFLFVNGQSMVDWLDCLSLTDDGVILGNHICSNMVYMMHDLHARKERLEKVKEHFKEEPYEIEILSHEQCKNNQPFLAAVELAKNKQQEFEKAGASIEFSDGTTVEI